jgi:CheY-like chemotaxis protein
MPKTLLLADDSVTIQKVVGISFANEDIEITTVDNGRDAVAKARTIRPDIILADVVMPGMSGYEVCETVKADPNLRHVPVLLLTGTFEAFDQARATAVGAAGHVAKPFEAQTLVDRVKQLLAAAPAPRASAPRLPAPAPAPVSAPAPARDDAFDFFSDEPAGSAPAPVDSGEAFDLDGPDGAFAFGDDDLAAEFPEPVAAPLPVTGAAARREPASRAQQGDRRPADATIAILPDPPGGQDDAFEFSFDREERGDALGEPVDPDQLGHATLLDPAAGTGLDISSSDLDYSRAPAAATQILAIDDGPQSLPLAAEDAELDLAETDPFDAPMALDEPFGADPFATTIAPAVTRSEPQAGEDRWAGEAERSARPREGSFDPFERDPFEDAPMMAGEPLSAGDDHDPEPPFAPARALAAEIDAEPWDDTSSFEAPIAMAEEADRASGEPAIARAELRDMIEKIAWDAFGPITEKIVREAIARIEQVAWEVVPKLAETLIQEEIRRLKSGGSS